MSSSDLVIKAPDEHSRDWEKYIESNGTTVYLRYRKNAEGYSALKVGVSNVGDLPDSDIKWFSPIQAVDAVQYFLELVNKHQEQSDDSQSGDNDQGDKGDKGDKGDDEGQEGGDKSDKSEKGDKGDKGDNGDNGDDEGQEEGDKSEKGEKGDKGDNGGDEGQEGADKGENGGKKSDKSDKSDSGKSQGDGDDNQEPSGQDSGPDNVDVDKWLKHVGKTKNPIGREEAEKLNLTTSAMADDNTVDSDEAPVMRQDNKTDVDPETLKQLVEGLLKISTDKLTDIVPTVDSLQRRLGLLSRSEFEQIAQFMGMDSDNRTLVKQQVITELKKYYNQ